MQTFSSFRDQKKWPKKSLTRLLMQAPLQLNQDKIEP